ncbi:hypothetical protein [Amycolatopsis sp. NPDC059657]|uniref:hypothetical protein n=1 Tax=Amycolatopsis sp. NPDC059657 TaxID=3346899 RepID=UPI00366F787B
MTGNDDTNHWTGAGWQVRRTAGQGQTISVRVDRQLDPDESRALSTALGHAAWSADDQPSTADWTHALLIALLVRAGGSVTLSLEDFEADALGGPDGQHYGYTTLAGPDGLTVAVTPAPARRS